MTGRKSGGESSQGSPILASSIGVITGLATSIAGYLTLLLCLKYCKDEGLSKVRPTKALWSTRELQGMPHKPIPTNVYQSSNNSGYRNVYKFSQSTYTTSGTENVQMSYTDATRDW